MGYEIYYFSETGNSLVVAKRIAEKLQAELIPISKIVTLERIHIDAPNIGIVFPSYIAPVLGVPLIVERFIKKIVNIQYLRIFAVCTCGGYECVNALPSLKKLGKIVRSCGGKLKEEYSVRLPMNNLDYDHIPVPIIRDQEVIIDRSRTKIDDICFRLINGKGTKHRVLKSGLSLLTAPMLKMMEKPVIDALKAKAKEPVDTRLSYYELIPLTDNSITVDDKCTGCGTCAKVCPAGNIRIVDKKPEFQHRCEMCFACDEWCPSKAVRHWSRAPGVKYHHPEVKLHDMLHN